ncbi:hypothetical protein GJAV_G00085740, partial [Gymnothorax javanicus]
MQAGAALLNTRELYCDAESSLMRDEATLPGLTNWHWVILKEEELCGLDSVLMAESEIKCTAPAQGPECVTAHTAVSDLPFTDTSLIKTETDLVSPNNGDVIKTESPDFMETAFVSHLHPEKVKKEAEGQYVKAGHRELLDMKCADMKSDEVKLESSEVSMSSSEEERKKKKELKPHKVSQAEFRERKRAEMGDAAFKAAHAAECRKSRARLKKSQPKSEARHKQDLTNLRVKACRARKREREAAKRAAAANAGEGTSG